MKLFDWISRKPNKDQAASNAADLLPRLQNPQNQRQHQQQVLKKSVHAVQSKLLKLNQFFDQDPSEPSSKRREIVKIFVNHEEYGLLAIGTLGLYDVSGVEPEIELFEVTPNLSFQPDGLKVEQEKLQEKEENGALVLRKPSANGSKKVVPLDPSTLIGGTKLLKRSKLLDRLLHPLTHLTPSFKTTPAQDDHPEPGKKSKSLSLFKKLVLGNSSPVNKQITSDTRNSSKKNSSLETRAIHNNHHSHHSSNHSSSGNSRRRPKPSSLFACVSLQVEEGDTEEEEEEEREAEVEVMEAEEQELAGVGAGGVKPSVALSPSPSTGCAACSVPGDPNPVHQQTCAKPEYWIRTDSDYVVLEL
ncbi:uncharacterized protein LOC9644693 [Selaginella moellendorffii]|uniref:uncharacterized protein LOC9644693 n=1 Tax=Selaginella moellendorffii TaxID=88036 RepID=UPI000D1D08F6|nr:uncharacterized protein LOC9644693 [Selaginella moellendorffii]|eukprot:XP_024544831.1 uncharacterized protein LOC9644693 [Selaginella moellendorffii]